MQSSRKLNRIKKLPQVTKVAVRIHRYIFNNFSYNYIALYNLGGIIMHRTISNYKITKKKGRALLRPSAGWR